MPYKILGNHEHVPRETAARKTTAKASFSTGFTMQGAAFGGDRKNLNSN